MRALVVLLSVVVPMSGCGGDRCRGVTCSNHGTCVLDNGTPRCLCNTGFVASGLSCQAGTTAPRCVGAGGTCSVNGDCCAFLQGDGYCVSGRCADACLSDGECNSGCCGTLVSGNKACAPASNCASTCRPVNASCVRNGDCCNFLAGTGYCVDGSCADACTLNSQCVSNCCAPLVGGGRTCASRSFCP